MEETTTMPSINIENETVPYSVIEYDNGLEVPSVTVQVDSISGSNAVAMVADVVGDGINSIYTEASNFLPLQAALAFVVLASIIIAVVKII